MATPSRVSLQRGTAVVKTVSPWDGSTAVQFSLKSDASIKDITDTLVINTSAAAHIDERAIEQYSELTLEPAGIWTTAVLECLYKPFANYKRGASLLNGYPASMYPFTSAADLPWVANGVDGEAHTLEAGAITKLPDLFLSAKKTMIGSMTVRGMRAKGKGWGDDTSLRNIGAVSGTDNVDASFALAKLPTQPYSATWGAVTGFVGFDTQDGWTISFQIGTQEIEVDSTGKLDIAFDSIAVMAKCVPVGPTSANILSAQKLQGSGVVRGYSLANQQATPNADLVITGQDAATIITLKQPALKTAGYEFGAFKLRAGEIGFVVTRPMTGGAPGELFTMAAANAS